MPRWTRKIGQRHGARSGSGPAGRHGGRGGAERERWERTIRPRGPRGPRRPDQRWHLHVGSHGADLRYHRRCRRTCQFDHRLHHRGDNRDNAGRLRERHGPQPRRPDRSRRHGRNHAQSGDRSAVAVPDGDQPRCQSIHRRGRFGLHGLHLRGGHHPGRHRRPGHRRLAGGDRPEADRHHLGGRHQCAVARPQPGRPAPSARVDRGTDPDTQRDVVRRRHHQRHHRGRRPLRRPADGRRGQHGGGRHRPRHLGGQDFGHGHGRHQHRRLRPAAGTSTSTTSATAACPSRRPRPPRRRWSPPTGSGCSTSPTRRPRPWAR